GPGGACDHESAGARSVEAVVADALSVTNERLHGAVAKLRIAIPAEDCLDDFADVGAEAPPPRLHPRGGPLAVLAMRPRHMLPTRHVRALGSVAARVRSDALS